MDSADQRGAMSDRLLLDFDASSSNTASAAISTAA
jgi:hypothetical protein